MSDGLRGRTALVTGAASGIGLAVARQLRAAGAEVVVCDLPGPGLDAVAAELGATAAGADLADPVQVRGTAGAAGDVDILVNNAGLQHVSPIEDFDEARWDRILAVMLTAPFLLTRSLLPGMYARGWGRVVNVASVHGLVASPFKSAYVAAKHGLIGFTKVLALEAAQRAPDVTAHAVAPSYVRTPLVEGQIADQARTHAIPEEEVVAKVLLTANAVKRLIEPEDVAAAVEWLCGPAAWTMSGSVLTMDAGWLAH
ncbi:MAG TPA: 3-hydroxybutyrate dehydrogenase [Candidatus Dormibacteraeota bacterium]|nr:3-hydroxybutyrate dehydrogenase [Candidatus Dormibacteraeota bacterium]